jgi:hypothetical protein
VAGGGRPPDLREARVLDPAGRPLAGARLYVGYVPQHCDYAKAPVVTFPVRGTTAADGQFDFTFALGWAGKK